MRATTDGAPTTADGHAGVGAVFAAIGRCSVRFRWLVVVVWVVGTVAAAHFLPSLASATDSDNADFLPASAPSSHAARLADALGRRDVQPITVIVATVRSRLSAADQRAVDGLRVGLAQVAGVRQVLDAGQSGDGQAEQLQAGRQLGHVQCRQGRVDVLAAESGLGEQAQVRPRPADRPGPAGPGQRLGRRTAGEDARQALPVRPPRPQRGRIRHRGAPFVPPGRRHSRPGGTGQCTAVCAAMCSGIGS